MAIEREKSPPAKMEYLPPLFIGSLANPGFAKESDKLRDRAPNPIIDRICSAPDPRFVRPLTHQPLEAGHQ